MQCRWVWVVGAVWGRHCCSVSRSSLASGSFIFSRPPRHRPCSAPAQPFYLPTKPPPLNHQLTHLTDALITTTNTSTTINTSLTMKLKHLSTCTQVSQESIYAATFRQEPFGWPKFLSIKTPGDKTYFLPSNISLHWRVDYHCTAQMKFSIWS